MGEDLNPGSPSAQEERASALDHWKVALRRDFEAWLDSLDQIPEDTDATLDAADTPDLYSFHAQLAAGNAETRKANRRTAEAFSQWGETLSRFDGDLRLLREQLARLPAAKEDALPRPWCLVLVEILDRAVRLDAAFAAPPPKSWWGHDARWRKAWATQRQGLDILVSHLEETLRKSGVIRLSALNQPFDPATMAAVAVEHEPQLPHHTVIEEVAPGYSVQGDLLRVAQVKVSTNKA
ncbi:MAG: molecular chaperone GrpE [Verrucomicrobiota bacterium]|jgi:molecular chaperone GrpE (heat shock protein)